MPVNKSNRSAWYWIPSLYFAEGLPLVIVMAVSVIMYKRLGISNTDIALYTSWLYLPWVIKPLWSPVVDILKTKRFWIITMQLIVGAGLGGVALTIPLPTFFQFTLGFLWLLAFSSATHDISADGFYMLGLSQHDQTWFVGVRSTFYRFAMITGQGLLIMLAGFIESNSGLGSLDIEVIAKPEIEISQTTHPDSINMTSNNRELKLLVHPQQLNLSTNTRSRHETDSIRQFVKEWNISKGFVQAEVVTIEKKKISWWDRTILKPIEDIIARYFGEEKKMNDGEKQGNFGLILFSLSRKPQSDEQIVVNFGLTSGDKSISLSESHGLGSRLTFNDQNWNKKAIAFIQLDPKLRQLSKAKFTAWAGNIPLAWSITFAFLAILFIIFFIYHKFILPYPESDKPTHAGVGHNFMKDYIDTFIIFFKKDRIGSIIAFLLLFRLAESQLVKLASPFLLDTRELGGLALTTGQVGFIYGTIGIIFLIFGGVLGGFLAAKHGLKFWLWPMAIAINIPDIVYVYMSYTQPDNLMIINACVAVEQFGYGFGFTAYMLYMIYASEGKHKTAHFAITTALMALGMMIPGMVSGWLQEIIGYKHFFIWIIIATIPAFLVLFFIPLDKNFGKKI